jgi:hypothetical protein
MSEPMTEDRVREIADELTRATVTRTLQMVSEHIRMVRTSYGPLASVYGSAEVLEDLDKMLASKGAAS